MGNVMLLREKKSVLKWNSANKKRYTEIGYKFTSFGDEFSVDIDHLTPTTRATIWYQCDYCKKEKETTYKKYMSMLNRSITKKDCCDNQECINKKIEESNLVKYGFKSHNQSEEVKNKKRDTYSSRYGVESPSQFPEFKSKMNKTVKERYGVDNVFQNEEIKKKSIITCNEKYGVDFYTQTEEQKEKQKKTNLIRYGFEFASQSPIIKDRIIKTNLKVYGVKHALQSPEIRNKGRVTLYKNGNAPTSKQQKYLHNLIGGELNYPIGQISLDIAFPESKIAVEYDGGGHWLSIQCGTISEEEFKKREMNRNYFLYRNGWKLIRIVSKRDLLPHDEVINKLFKDAESYLSTGRHWYYIDIDESRVKCSQHEESIELGDLRNIKENDLINQFNMN